MRSTSSMLAVLVLACTAPPPEPRSRAAPPAVAIPAPESPSGSPARRETPVGMAASDELGLGCPAVCRGTLAAESVEALRREIANVRRCYERQLESDPALEGRMVVELLLLADGTVCSVRHVEDEIDSPALASCVLSFFQSIRLRPEQGCVTLRVPLVFRTSADAGP